MIFYLNFFFQISACLITDYRHFKESMVSELLKNLSFSKLQRLGQTTYVLFSFLLVMRDFHGALQSFCACIHIHLKWKSDPLQISLPELELGFEPSCSCVLTIRQESRIYFNMYIPFFNIYYNFHPLCRNKNFYNFQGENNF